MIRILIWSFLLYVCYRIFVSITSGAKPAAKLYGKNGPAETTHRDPVCGIYVSEESAVIGRHDGQRHYFCSMDCLEKYREQLAHITK